MDPAQVEATVDAGSQEHLVGTGTVRVTGGSNKRALKIAGLTTLACLLLASQVFTAYMVSNQKEEIRSLQKNSENMRKLLKSKAYVAPAQMRLPMPAMPLLMDLTDDGAESAKTPLTKLQPTAKVSLEKQVKDLLQDSALPQFNETFLVNLQHLKENTEDTDWKGLESWMRYWLIFQMAQEKPPAPSSTQSATVVETKCQSEARLRGVRPGFFKPQCDQQGNYRPIQCWTSTGFCWCVDQSGNPIEGTTTRGKPECHGGLAPRRMMAFPKAMPLKTFRDVADEN